MIYVCISSIKIRTIKEPVIALSINIIFIIFNIKAFLRE
jgi:hypothetical protein